VGLILVHGLLDVTAIEMAPEVTTWDFSHVAFPHPLFIVVGYLVIIGLLVFLWKLAPAIGPRPREGCGRQLASGWTSHLVSCGGGAIRPPDPLAGRNEGAQECRARVRDIDDTHGRDGLDQTAFSGPRGPLDLLC
jgi:hypothetical protein